MPRLPIDRVQDIRILREWCRYDSRLTLMLLHAALGSLEAEELETLVEFASEWRKADYAAKADSYVVALEAPIL